MGRIDIRDRGPVNTGIGIILPAQRLDQAVRHRLINLSLQKNRIGQETLVVPSESSIHRDRSTHAVYPLLQWSKDQTVSPINILIIHRPHPDRLRDVPIICSKLNFMPNLRGNGPHHSPGNH